MTASPTLTTTCPSWCSSTTKNDACTTGEHYPDLDEWPTVAATADPEYDGDPKFTAYPSWAESEGIQPAVTLFMEGSKRSEDVSVSLSPDEAFGLAARLVTAAAAVRAG